MPLKPPRAPKTSKVHYAAQSESLTDVLLANTVAKWQAGMPEEERNLHRYSGHVERVHPETGQAEWVRGDWESLAEGALAFFREVLKFRPKPYQEEMVRRLCRRKRLCARAPRGAGKSAIMASIIIWFAVAHGECKIPTTAGSWRQLEEYLWPEIHKWVQRGDWTLLPKAEKPLLNNLSFEFDGARTRRAFAVTSDQPELIEGAHADAVLLVFDEAKAIVESIFDAAEGTLARGNKWAICASTPGSPTGRFYDIQSGKPGTEDWEVMHITYEDVRDGILDPEEREQYIQWAEQRKKQWGADSPMYRNHVLGEFADTNDEQVVPLAWVELAHERYAAWKKEGFPVEAQDVRKLGVDVAGQGKDRTCIARRVGYRIRKVTRHAKQQSPQVVALVLAEGREYPCVNIEADGMGAPIVQYAQRELRDLVDAQDPVYAQAGIRIYGVISGGKSEERDASGELRFRNTRSRMWWRMRELLDPANGYEVCLPPDPDLTADLTTPKWSLEGDMICVEKKDDIRKRLPKGRSTDAADAVIIAFHDRGTPVVTAQVKVEVNTGPGALETFYNPVRAWPGYGGRRW